VEVLVALAIVAVALLAAMRAAGQGAVNASELRARLFAGWVAENRLAEHRARQDWLELGIRRGTASQGGMLLAWREEVLPMPSPAFRRLDVFVFDPSEESRSLAHLTGFLLLPPGTAR
jgi:general secretion pathway protein I